MSGNNILVDTNILIEFLNGSLEFLSVLSNNTIFISFITKIEILSHSSLSSNEIYKIDNFLNSNTNIIFIDNNITFKTAEIRRLKGVKTPDAIIIATANENNLKILTKDKGIINKIENQFLV